MTAIAYLLFGAGYIAYITFLSVYLTERHTSAPQVALTWTLLGLSAVAAPVLWSRPILAWRDARALATLLAILGGAAALALTTGSLPIILISAVAYGVTFLTVPAAITALIRHTTPPGDWPETLAAFTVFFAVGQTGGAWIAGALADHTGAGASLAWTAALCLSGAALALTERTSAACRVLAIPGGNVSPRRENPRRRGGRCGRRASGGRAPNRSRRASLAP